MKKRKETAVDKRVEFARFEVLKNLHEGLSISETAKVRHVSRQAIYNVLQTLIKKGMVRNPKRSIYELTEKGIKGLHSFVGLRYNLRQHNVAIKVEVLDSPKNWDLKRQELRSIPYFNRTISLNNNEQDLFSFGRLWVKTTSKSVIIKFPTLYSRGWEGAILQLIQLFEDSIPKIEKLFKVRLVKDYKANIMFISNEYALLQDALAKLYRSEGNRMYLTGDDGKIWLITDFSFSVDELEFIHPDKATDDVDSIAPFINDLRKNPITLSQIRDETKKVLELQKAYADNIVKHQKVLDEMMREFRDFKEWRNKHYGAE